MAQYIYIVVRNDISPDIRIDAGGGEVGISSVLGAFLTREKAELRIKKDLETDFKADRESDIEISEMTLEEYMEYRSDYLEYRVEEVELI